MRECEEMLKIVQGCRDLRLDLRVTHDWQVTKVGTCEAYREAEESCQLLHYRTKVLGWLGR